MERSHDLGGRLGFGSKMVDSMDGRSSAASKEGDEARQDKVDT